MITEEGKNGEINYINIDTTKVINNLDIYRAYGEKFSYISTWILWIWSKKSNNENKEEKVYLPTSIPLIVIIKENI